MNRLIPYLLVTLMLCAPGGAESLDSGVAQRSRSRSKVWRASLLSIVAASALDTHSSYARYEANPLLRGADGRFRMQGIGVKAAITGGVIGVQFLLLRRGPKADKAAAFANFGLSGVLAGAALTNYSRPRPPSAPLTVQRRSFP